MLKLFVTTDFSANSKAGVKFALQLQAQTKCELVFYHVVEIMKPTSWNDIRYKLFAKQKIADFTEKLIAFVSNVKGEEFKAKGSIAYKVEIGTSIDQMVIQGAKKNKANFICMATKGAGRVQKFFGTNASAMINNSPIPVIVVPSGYKSKAISSIFYASDFAALGPELKKLQSFSASTQAKIKVFHYDYLLHVPENKMKLEKTAAKYATKDLSFQFRRQEIEFSLAAHLKKDIQKEKPELVVLFTKQNRKWFDRLFPSSEAQEMAFNTKLPLLVYRKKPK
jgi:nucleotide-binding universal stress UspA family protein